MKFHTSAYLFILLWGFLYSEEGKGQIGNPDSLTSSFQEIIQPDSLSVDSLAIPKKKEIIDFPINYKSFNKIDFDVAEQKAYLHDGAVITYKDIELAADYIELDLRKHEVYAEGVPDSTGKMQGEPVFKQGNEEFQAKRLRYNFDTGKGLIYGVITEQTGGYVHSEITKRINEQVYCLKNGKYTTCDAEHPHFYLHMTKAKVVNKNKIVTGPAYMVLEDLPLYFIMIPFGFFPNSPTYSSGILIPTYGEEQNRGFFLRDGGYYWAINDYLDASIRGDIYSMGSWGIKLHNNYKLRYRFSGSFDFKYFQNKYGDQDLPNAIPESKEYSITWTHRQDPKANPFRTFSASVNYSTSSYDRNNAYSSESYLRNTKSSSISYTKKWENSPFSMSANLRHSQNSSDSSISLSIPEMTFNMSRIYPFKKKERAGKSKWYEKIGLGYSSNLRNSITTKESELWSSSLTKDWKNGMKHSIPVSTSFKALKYFTMSPSISYNERWYTQRVKKELVQEEDTSYIAIDTLYGFTRDYDYSFSVGTSTKIYGMYQMKSKKSRLRAIRHVMTPSISFSYRPDFSDPRFNLYDSYFDEDGEEERYSKHENGIFGFAPEGRSGSIGLTLNNNIEAKFLNTRDTTSRDKYKKVPILDNFSISASYNLAADSMNLSTINMRGRTKVRGVNVSFGGVLDPYALDEENNRIAKYTWQSGGGIGRLISADLSFGMSFKSKEGKEKSSINEELIEGEENLLTGRYEDYIDFNVPWDFRFDYSLRYSNPLNNPQIIQSLNFSGGFSLTPKWKFTFRSGFDFEAKELTYTSVSVSRDLHCWDMSFNLVPFGYRQSYSFTLRAKAAMLADLKLKKQKSWYDRN